MNNGYKLNNKTHIGVFLGRVQDYKQQRIDLGVKKASRVGKFENKLVCDKCFVKIHQIYDINCNQSDAELKSSDLVDLIFHQIDQEMEPSKYEEKMEYISNKFGITPTKMIWKVCFIVFYVCYITFYFKYT